ncbi:GDSL-type esterase/lipase family protein [Crossiella cryophila]|uniref:Lysophospholipase L1-like esterase n=1 Tax=Crossiella cryophila TaxID=43355 RepID=A0A7W7FY25_9PSEU|nr:GDSL-type esterase/lipase family protein [Crossiella cryophila]MBB4681263.1 lysophospholipase L1-like esterase [Crossiella cryophila]
MSGHWRPVHRAAIASPYDAFAFAPARRFTDTTLRQIVHLHRGGPTLRLHVDNRFGRTPLEVGELRVARHLGAGRIGPDALVTAGAAKSFTVAAGERVITDAVALTLPDDVELAISLYLPGTTPWATLHPDAGQISYARQGNSTAVTALFEAEELSSLYWLSGVDALTDSPAEPVVVAFGDSLTDGTGTTPNTNQRYPDHLSRALGLPVLNLGLSGNRLLRDGFGQAGVTRFQRDVLAVPGLTHVIIALGTNDIGLPTMWDQPQPGAAEIIEGLTLLAEAARAAGVLTLAATLPPTSGTVYGEFFTAEGDLIRRAVNRWIRESPLFTGVVDFDAAVRDPGYDLAYRAELDSGDHLHPNDAGAAAMAAAVPLAAFGR